MSNTSRIITLVLKAVAVGMSIAAIVLGVLGTASVETLITMLSIGLAALAIASLQQGEEPE